MNSEDDILCDDEANMEKIEEEKTAVIKSMLPKLYFIWNEVGIDLKQKKIRANAVWEHLINLLQEIIDEESSVCENIQERIKTYNIKIQELTRVLCIPEEEEVNGTLIRREEILRQRLDNLTKVKHKRLKTYQDLHMVEDKYCTILGLPTHKLSSNTGVPSEKDLFELEQHVNMLKEERNQRLQKFCQVKRELTTILEVTELTPETRLEKDILSIDDDEKISLSNETLKALENIVIKLQNRKANLESEKKCLMDKLTTLWERLNVTQTERELFLSKHEDCRISTLKSLKAEIERCEEIKRQNIKMYISSLREELIDLWNKCFVSETQRQLFEHLNSNEFTEEILSAYETEVEEWKNFYKDTECIINKINKRQRLWDIMITFENKANDPNRFKNRRGNLLQEERERKKLQKQLPALENEIFSDIENFEATKGNPFLYHGEDFRMFVTRQWEKRMSHKENEKLLRQKQRTMQLENEVTMGTTPCKRPMSAVPKSAPSKLFRPTVGLPIYRTPNSYCKVMPNTVGRLRSKGVQKSIQKNVLKEKNSDQKSTSSSFDETSYNEFAEKLNRSSRTGHRSSVLSSRKIVGTRISQNSRSKKSNVNKSSHRSFRKKTDMSKITPARGKLGLPFII